MTTLYFKAEDEDDLRKIGFSKDGKFQYPQIMLGLLVGEGGLPIGYNIFEGNTFKGHTLLPILKQMQKRYGFQQPIAVADAAMLSEMKEDDFDELLKMAVHEVRHRAQCESDIDIITDKNNFLSRTDKYRGLEQYREEVIKYADKIAEMRRKSKRKLPPHIEKQEFDSLVAEVVGPSIIKKGASVQEVADEIIKTDADEMLANAERRLK